MDQAEVQELFRRFAAPLAGYAATSVQRKEGVEFMARTLWTAMSMLGWLELFERKAKGAAP